MKNFSSKQVLPLILGGIGLLFAYVGFFELKFWSNSEGPMPGFFPTIMAIVMVIFSILSFFQSLKEVEQTKYKKEELLVIAAALGIFLFTFFIGLLPSLIIYVILWLKFFEKESVLNIVKVLAVVLFIAIGVFYCWLGIQFPLGILENFL